jgi:hypothetical protein
MKIGLYYQAGVRYVACYHALKQFRSFYPNAPVAMYEDNTDILLPVAKKFNCDYKKTVVKGRNDPNSGRPAYDLNSILAWMERVHEACTTVLKDVEYVMNFEDDVWFLREVTRMPKYELSGIGGVGWKPELLDYLNVSRYQSIYGCGGSVFNREKYIEAYQKINSVDWKAVEKLDNRPLEWTDSALTFMFLHAGFNAGPWEDADQYRHSNIPHMGDRAGWPGTMDDMKKEQRDVAVIHCWKPYYYPTEEEIKEVDKDLENYK